MHVISFAAESKRIRRFFLFVFFSVLILHEQLWQFLNIFTLSGVIVSFITILEMNVCYFTGTIVLERRKEPLQFAIVLFYVAIFLWFYLINIWVDLFPHFIRLCKFSCARCALQILQLLKILLFMMLKDRNLLWILVCDFFVLQIDLNFFIHKLCLKCLTHPSNIAISFERLELIWSQRRLNLKITAPVSLEKILWFNFCYVFCIEKRRPLWLKTKI